MSEKYTGFLFFIFLFGLQLGWSQPKIEAEGKQTYCPLTQIPVATKFDISDPDNTAISELFIQISTGYLINEDKLFLTVSHPNIATSWNNTEGKLTLSGVGGAPIPYPDLINAVLDVMFESNSQGVSGSRYFSFSIGNANYLPSTGHYYEFVPALGITWQDAKNAAATRTYYGLEGYLATIGSAEESQLAGKQASGAGWIGGTDEEQEGVWKWATGPEAGTIFWNGGPNGSAPSGQYSNWNSGEPNNLGDENYAHITAPGVGVSGSWNDLSNTGGASGDYQPKGYIVEYGTDKDSNLHISAFTEITVDPIFKEVKLPSVVPVISACDTDDNNGFAEFNLTDYKLNLSNGALESDYSIRFFTDSNYSIPIANPSEFTNSEKDGQTIYIRIIKNSSDCFINTSFLIQVDKLPVVPDEITYKNCDEDGLADGLTNFNLNEIDVLLYPNNTSGLTISYHLTAENANENDLSLIPSPFNNDTASTVYARVENANGCYAVSTIHLQVSTTSFPEGYLQEIVFCDDDGVNDGIYSFDLNATASGFLAQFPTGQNLSVHYYENATDAQLNQNEIPDTSNYINSKSPFSQRIYIRVQSADNGDCFGVGPHLQLTVNPLPEFKVRQNEIFCLMGEPIVLEVFEEEDDSYSYTWKNQLNEVISTQRTVIVNPEGTYSVIATSVDGCESVPVEFTALKSEIAKLTDDNVTIDDLSGSNTVTIDISNLGIGDYEFSLRRKNEPYQDSPIFTNVSPGVYKLSVKDKNGCGIAELQVYVMGFPKYFTPNNDGSNDFWNLKGFEDQFTQQSYIDIYDRYGLFLARIQLHDRDGWDGRSKGTPLPASDYWYVAHFLDHKGQMRNFKGHFSLLR